MIEVIQLLRSRDQMSTLLIAICDRLQVLVKHKLGAADLSAVHKLSFTIPLKEESSRGQAVSLLDGYQSARFKPKSSIFFSAAAAFVI
jgi:hypothetical protein